MIASKLVRAPTAEPQPLRVALLCLGGAMLSVPLVAAENTFVYLVVIGQLACLLAPVWYRWWRHEMDYFEPIHLVGLLYFMFFGLSSIWVIQDPGGIGYDRYVAAYVPAAALYCLGGQVAMLLGYFGPWHVPRRAARPPEWPRGLLFLLGTAGVGFLGFVAQMTVEQSFHVGSKFLAMLSPVAQLTPLFLYAWSLGWCVLYTGLASRAQRFALFAVLAPATLAVIYMTVSDKSLVITLMGVPIMARWYGIRRLPWTLLFAVLLVLIFIVFPFYNAYRWSDPHLSTMTRMEQTYHELQSWDARSYARFSFTAFKIRMALINSVAVVVRDVGRWVPFAYGETMFLPTLTGLVPRYLWPDKPINQTGREFGRLFRVTNFVTRDTFIAVTLPGELYWNFHVPGILLGMWAFGWLMRRLYQSYGEGPEFDPGRRAVHLLIVIQLVHWGATIPGDGVSLLRTLVLLTVLRSLGRLYGLLRAPLVPAPTSRP